MGKLAGKSNGGVEKRLTFFLSRNFFVMFLKKFASMIYPVLHRSGIYR
jgi:hypothetical protein